ncbi:hypothetical protein PHYSODRAFT_403067, partial [Phytophthora sojae]
LAPSEAERDERIRLISRALPVLAAQAASQLPQPTYQPTFRELLEVKVRLDGIPLLQPLNAELHAFWGTFAWVDNPWIPDSNAPTLQRRKYDRIEVTSLRSSEITRTGVDTYTVRRPTAYDKEAGHTAAKLQRWLLVILLCSPRLNIGAVLGAFPPLQLRRSPTLSQTYTWSWVGDGLIVGTGVTDSTTIPLRQQPNGIN